MLTDYFDIVAGLLQGDASYAKTTGLESLLI